MADATTISVLIKARDQASAAFKNVENNAGRMAQGINRNRRAIGMGMLAMGAAITGVGVVMAKTAATFDAKMREVNSLIGLSQAEFQKLTDETLEMSSAIGIDAVKASEALYQAISAGVPRENVIEFMTIASKAAIAGVTDTTVAVDVLTTVINAFKMPMSEAQRVADILFVAVKGGKTTLDELAAAMSYVAPIAAALNVPFEAIGAAAATMTKQGIPTKMAFTALRQTFVSLMKPTVEMESALDQVGFATGRALLEAHGLQAGLQLLMTGTSLTEAEMTKAFGSVEAFNAVLALTGQNAEEAASDLAKSYDHMGKATDAFNIINEGTARQFEIMQARLKVVSIELGTILLPIVIAITGKVSDMADKFRDFYKDHPTLVKWVGLIGLALGGLLIVFGALALMLPGLIAGFTILWGVAFAPATAVILAVTAAIVAGIIIWKKWEDASVKVRITMLAIGAIMIFALGPISLLIAAVFAGIAIWKNWDLVVSKAKKVMAETAQAVIYLVRQLLVGIKAVSDLVPWLKGTSDAIQQDIDMLDRMTESMNGWANETERATQLAAEGFAAFGDAHLESARSVMMENASMGDSTSDAAEVIKKALADTEDSHNDLAKTTAESTEKMALAWGTLEDEIGIAQGGIIRSLEDLQGEQETFDALQRLSLLSTISVQEQKRLAYIANNDAIIAASKERRDKEADALAQQTASWDTFKQNLDPVMMAINEQNLGFAEIVQLMADDAGKSLEQMGKDVEDAGITWRDTWGLVNSDVGKNLDEILGNVKMTGEGVNKAALTWQQALASGIDTSKLTPQHFKEIGKSEETLRAAGRAMARQKVGRDLEAWRAEANRAAGFSGSIPDWIKKELEGTEALYHAMRPISQGGPVDLMPFQNFQGGGIVTQPTLAMIGEAGPEAVIPLGRGGGMGTTNNFHFHGSVYGVEDLKEAVVEAVRDHAISGGFSGVFAEA